VTWVSRNVSDGLAENDLENEFQFQYQGYAVGGGAVNPLRHKRA
jgi:hypothetical protein